MGNLKRVCSVFSALLVACLVFSAFKLPRVKKVGAGVNELIINQIAQRAGGIPTTYEDVIFVETPRPQESSLAQLRTARYGADYLDGQYENGAQGATHKFELIYYPTTVRADGFKIKFHRVFSQS